MVEVNNEYDLENNLMKRIPVNYTRVENKAASVNIERILRHEDDTELILFELPKDFDKTLLNKIKIKNFGSNGKITKLTGNYQGICFDSTHPIPRQTLGGFMKKDKKTFLFRPMDRYVKVFEHIDMPDPTTECVVPRRIVIQKRLGKRKNKKRGI